MTAMRHPILLHVLDTLDFGGVESNALTLIRSMPDIEHVVVSVGRREGPRAYEFRRLARVVECPYVPPRRVSFMRRLSGVIDEIGPRAVLAYNFGNHAMVAGACRLARVRQMFVQVASDPATSVKTLFKASVLAHAARPFCSGEIAVSEFIKSQLTNKVHMPRRRIHVIPYGCDVTVIRERAQTARSERPQEDVFRMMMVARLEAAKDHATLLLAVAKIRDQHPNISLWLAGDGPSRDEIASLIDRLELNDKVTLLGNRDDVPELLGRTDLLVHSTHSEAFGICLIEAMAAGVPVISSELPATKEVLANGLCGWLVPPGDVDGWVEAVGSVIADRGVAQRVGAAFDRVASVYDVPEMADEYRRRLFPDNTHHR